MFYSLINLWSKKPKLSGTNVYIVHFNNRKAKEIVGDNIKEAVKNAGIKPDKIDWWEIKYAA